MRQVGELADGHRDRASMGQFTRAACGCRAISQFGRMRPAPPSKLAGGAAVFDRIELDRVDQGSRGGVRRYRYYIGPAHASGDWDGAQQCERGSLPDARQAAADMAARSGLSTCHEKWSGHRWQV